MFAQPRHLSPRGPRPSRAAVWSTMLFCAALALTLAACGGSASATNGAHATATPTPPKLSLDARLANETLYVVNASPSAISASGWSLTALNAQTGAIRWKLPTGGMIGKPVIANGAIYFAPQDGYVYAVDAATGHTRWRFQRTVNVSQTVGIDGYPALDGDTLYVASDGGALYALDARTGTQRWLFTLPQHGHMYAAPAAGGGMVYVSSAGGANTFYALDEASGKIVWQLTEPEGFDSYPLLEGATVYTGANAYYQASLYALDARTGKIRWRYIGANLVITRPALDGDHLVIGVTDTTVHELNAQTGKEDWRAAIGDQVTVAAIPTGAAPAVADGVVYAGAQSGVVEALDEKTGAMKWKQTVDGSVDSAPAVADGAVYVTTEQGSVYAFRASDGALSWRYADGGLIYASPVIAP